MKKVFKEIFQQVCLTNADRSIAVTQRLEMTIECQSHKAVNKITCQYSTVVEPLPFPLAPFRYLSPPPSLFHSLLKGCVVCLYGGSERREKEGRLSAKSIKKIKLIAFLFTFEISLKWHWCLKPKKVLENQRNTWHFFLINFRFTRAHDYWAKVSPGAKWALQKRGLQALKWEYCPFGTIPIDGSMFLRR